MIQPRSSEKPIVFGHGHIGASKTREYEDRRYAGTFQTKGGLEITLAMVADGVGGGNLGQRAAQATVDTIVEYCQNSIEKDVPQILGRAIGAANRKVYEEGSAREDSAQMSSTVAIAAIVNQKLYVANVGDSRVYLIRDQKVIQITVDHNWAVEKAREGKLTRDEANRHPNAHYLMRSVGYEANVKVDLGLYIKGGTESGEEAFRQQGLPLGPNDIVLVCSDGLIKNRPNSKEVYVSPQEMLEVVERSNAEQTAKTLVDIAVGKNVDDNVTAVVVEMPGRKRKMLHLPRVQISAAAAIIIAASLCVVLGGVTALIASNRKASQIIPTPLPGSVYIVEGTLSSREAGSEQAVNRSAGESIYFNFGTVVTAQEGDVTLSLPENFQVQLHGDQAAPTIVELYQAPTANGAGARGTMILKLRQGKLLAIAGGGANKNVDLVIETSNGRAIISGTILGTVYDVALQEFVVDCFTGTCDLETSQTQKRMVDEEHCVVSVRGEIDCAGEIDLAAYGTMNLARNVPVEILNQFATQGIVYTSTMGGASTFVSTATFIPTPMPGQPTPTDTQPPAQRPATATPKPKPTATEEPKVTPSPSPEPSQEPSRIPSDEPRPKKSPSPMPSIVPPDPGG